MSVLTRRASAAIAVVVVVPWMIGHALMTLDLQFADNLEDKDRLWRAHVAPIDTVVVGDSMVQRIDLAPMKARGWEPFNLALPTPGVEDIAMQVQYARMHGRLRRMVIGVSFHNMIPGAPFEHSNYVRSAPFADPAIQAFAEVEAGSAAKATPARPAAWWRRVFLPTGRARMSLRVLLDRVGLVTVNPAVLPDGSLDNTRLWRELSNGQYDRQAAIDSNEMLREQEFVYRQRPELSLHAQAIFVKVLSTLRRERMNVVIFETEPAPRVQQLIDNDPVLSRLRAEWRAFFAAVSQPCTRFFDRAAARGVILDHEFFDAKHYLGDSERRLGQFLTEKLEQGEVECSGR